MRTVRQQLFLPNTGAPTGRGVRIAVIDTGVALAHPDLQGRVIVDASRSFSPVSDDIEDRNGHGSHIAGIIAGTGASSAGVYRGIAPEAELIVLKSASQDSGLEGNAIRGVEAALEAGADIINFSHGYGPDFPPPWLWPERLSLSEEAFVAAAERGVLCVVAAGNKGRPPGNAIVTRSALPGSVTRPGGLSEVLTVAAIDQEGVPLPTSGRGPYRRAAELRPNEVVRFDAEIHRDHKSLRKPDIALPGRINSVRAPGLLLTGLDGEADDPDYVTLSGTSQATAVASGLAALLLETARANNWPLGPNPGRAIRCVMVHAARATAFGDTSSMGAGLPIWPSLLATLQDFGTDSGARQAMMHPGLTLL